jgi:tight adherence protein B
LICSSTTSVWADGEGSIDHAETRDGELRVLYSLPELAEGVRADLGSLQVSVNGDPLEEAEAELATAAGAAEQVRRTTIMTIDTSNSMRGDRFEQAKAAAKAFLEAAPDDLYVGIVAFAGSVEVVQAPTLDRSAAISVIDELSLSLETRLYDGVIAAAETAGAEGQRSLLVLSDGRDTSETALEQAVKAIGDAEVRVDVVALGEAATANPPLESMASQGGGSVIAAQDPDALTTLFSEEAAALARQFLVTANLPEEFSGKEGSLSVSLTAGEETFTDKAFVSFGTSPEDTSSDDASGPLPVSPPSVLMSREFLWGGLSAMGLGALVILLSAFGVLGKREKQSLEQQISAYTRSGGSRNSTGRHGAPGAPRGGVTQSAVGIAEKALQGNGVFESKLSGKLDAAHVTLKPAEWLLLHSGIAFGAAFFGFLLGSGSIPLTLLLLATGALLPWLYLGVRKSRRLKAFNEQLPETLQLIAGSLSAGLSLAQSMDTVVREGSDPVAGEFRRALVEARLGVQVEDSLESIARRMESVDFEWVVMAIRIQREVGGNLSELLLQVASTMREREYLRRQVKTLSAEGKMSAWILGALPPGMFLYMMVSNPGYLSPMFTNVLGWVMLGGAIVMMGIGAFWMSRVVKVEV